MEGKLRKVSLLLALLALLCGMVFAQTETGNIVGTVTDPQGAVVSGAKVTVTNTGTGASRSATTNANGLYTVTNLQPGNYAIKVEAPNFQPVSKQLSVTVGSRNTIDFPLAVSTSQTTVEVVGEGGVAVETQTQQLSQVVTGEQVTSLPTITRNPYSLVGTSGNVTSTGVTGAARGAGFSINGQRDSSTDILLDGGENVDEFTASVGQQTPLDSVGEFRVITSNFSAEYGRASGGVVNVATKSGTNAFHGSVYEFWRGAGLSSNTYDNNASMTDALVAHATDPITNPGCATINAPDCPGVKSNFVRNQFGYSVGGPVMKDKLFFFSSTEWIRIRSNGQVSAFILDPAWIAASAAPATQAFYSSYGTLVPNVHFTGITTSNMNPQPTTCTGGPCPVWDKIQYNVPADAGGGAPSNQYENVERVDFNMTDKTQMYWRYALQSEDLFPGTNANSPYVGYDTGQTIFNNNFLWNVTHIWGPNTVTQSKFVFNRLNDVQPINGTPVPTLYGSASRAVVIGSTPIMMPGYLPTAPGSGLPFGGPQNLYQFYQDLSWTKGRHQFRFGGQYIHTRDNRVFGAYETAGEALGTDLVSAGDGLVNGTLTSFNGAVNPQGHFPCATDPTGVPIVTPACTINLPVGPPRFDRANRYHDFAAYAQDSWKATDRLTLNLGVRWEYYGVQHNNNPAFDSNFYLGPGANYPERVRNGQVMLATDPANPVGGLWKPDYNNFAPRVGFAWDLFGDGKTSLRGGYGIGFERNFGNVTFNVIQNPPNYAVISLQNGDPGCAPCSITVDNSGPLAGASGAVPLPKTSLRAPIQNMSTAYAHFWSLALEREVAKNTVFALEYTGSKGVKEYSIANPNRHGAGPLLLGDNPADQALCVACYPGATGTLPPATIAVRRLNDQYSGINQRGQQGFSFYSGLNVRFQTNNIHNTGLSLTSNYTWSHAIDNTSSTFSEFGNDFNLGLLNPFFPQQDKGDANFDVRHRWVMSGTWDTPWFKNGGNWFARNIFGGWTLAPIVSIQSGYPFSLWDCTEAFFDACPRFFLGDTSVIGQQTAHDVASPEGPLSGGTNTWDYVTYDPTKYFDYINPAVGTGEWGVCGVGQGLQNLCPFPSNMLGRNTFRGPGLWNMDLGVYKTFKITERFGLQLRGEAYNIFNHSNLYVQGGSADASVTEGTFLGGLCTGVSDCPAAVTAKRGGFGNTATDERRNIQLGLKLLF